MLEASGLCMERLQGDIAAMNHLTGKLASHLENRLMYAIANCSSYGLDEVEGQ